MTANELAYKLEKVSNDMEHSYVVNDWKLLFESALVLRKQAKEIEELKADAERYRYLRSNCYKLKYPNSEIDKAMELNFVVSGVWADNKNPEVLDGLIDFMHKEAKND